jgi:molecular chaperone GrpE
VSQDVAVAEDIVSDGLDSQDSLDARSALQRERDDLYDRLLRSTAEFDNYRKRVERERRDLVEAASSDLVRDLLPVIDDFDRALAAAPAGDPMRRGVELIHRRLLDMLKTRGVEPFNSIGQIFDPAWHEGVATEPANGRPDGQIVAELRHGYRMNGKLLRAAQVKVAQS